MESLRKELDLYDAPFILGGLCDFLAECTLDDNLKNYVFVNKQLQNIFKYNEMVGFVTAEGWE